MIETEFNPSTLPADKAPKRSSGAAFAQFLLPGQLRVATSPVRFSTILGSCVTLCLWDSRRKIGGMNHVMLPDGPADARNRYRYANLANPELLDQMIAAGSALSDLTASVYGGAAIHAEGGKDSFGLGARNAGAVVDFLRNHGIRVSVQETGGRQSRKIVFDLENGQTTVEKL